jgi:hypothetical protein
VYVNLNRGPDGFIGAPPHKEDREKAMEIGKPLTPKSERGRSTYGSLQASLQTIKGLCLSIKCIKREGHAGDCWPS